jgi:heme-degrading monooxygenase HmoA
MYARVWQFVILPGKIKEFAAAANAMMPILQQHAGFRGCIVLRSGPEERLEVTVVSTWASIEDLRNSETKAYQQALVDALPLCEPRPSMREEEVMISVGASEDLDDTVTKF